MGSDVFYPEEAPSREVLVRDFWIDETPVTNGDYAHFVAATGYVTVAEMAPEPRLHPGMSAGMARPGSLVFEKTAGPVDLNDVTQWWDFRFGAHWRMPLGPGSTIQGIEDHPVVHVAYADALAYADWAGKSLPTEAEWEFAARGGLVKADYAWGDELAPGGAMMANYWQGLFPFANQLLDGYERTSPVRAYPVNGYGLYDMIGNVWEWTEDWYAPAATRVRRTGGCCKVPQRSRNARKDDGGELPAGGSTIGRKVLKGGSHLCAANYCQRYRPAARHPQTVDTSTSHIGFRCVVRPESQTRTIRTGKDISKQPRR